MPGDRQRSVLVVRLGAIGDLILSLPALREIRRRHPGDELVLVSSPHAKPLFEDEQWLDRIVNIEDPEVQALFLATSSRDQGFHDSFGAVRKLYGWLRDPTLVQTGISRLGIESELLPPVPRAGERIHVGEHLLRTLGAPAGELPRLAPEPAKVARWRERLSLGDRRAVMIHAGAGGVSKRWPVSRFLEIADELVARDFEPLFLFGPADLEERLELKRLANLYRVIDSVVLAELAALLALGRAFLGNDSGPAHLAAAIGTPTLALFGPTDPVLWAPRGDWAQVLRSRSGEMKDLPVGEVWEALEELLAKTLPS